MSQSVLLADTFDMFSLACSNDSAISVEANFMRQASREARSSKESSEALFGTNSRAIERVWALFNECSTPDWDGNGADPLLLQTVYGAIELIRALPSEMPMPEFSVEPDGAIAMDWMKSRSTVFSLSISTNERIPPLRLAGWR